MKLKDMISTLRSSQLERIEIRDDAGNELFTCKIDSSVLTPYLEYGVTQWFPHGASGSNADFTVYVFKEGKAVQDERFNQPFRTEKLSIR